MYIYVYICWCTSTYINSSKEINDEDSKFKIDDIVRISK